MFDLNHNAKAVHNFLFQKIAFLAFPSQYVYNSCFVHFIFFYYVVFVRKNVYVNGTFKLCVHKSFIHD